MQYLEKDILFGNVKSFGVSLKVPGPITAYGKYVVNEQGYIEHHGYDYVVNAIDIHWGGAQLQNSGKIINTTAQLLELIDSISPGVYENFATVDSLNDANHRILDLRNTIEALEINNGPKSYYLSDSTYITATKTTDENVGILFSVTDNNDVLGSVITNIYYKKNNEQ